MRRRVLAAILGVAAVSIAALAIPLMLRLGHDARSDAANRLEREAVGVATRVPARLLSGGHAALPDLALSADLAIYDAHGRRLAGEGPAMADSTTRGALAGHTTRGVHHGVTVAVPVVRAGDLVAVVRVGEPGSVSDAVVRRQRAAILVFGVAALLVALAIGLRVSAAIARPLSRLNAATADLGTPMFAAPAPPSNIKEVDALTRSLSEASNRLTTLIERERAFSARASHQLRTPLSSLRLAIETELEAPRGGDEVLHEALREIDRLEATVESLLALARDEAPHVELRAADAARAAHDRWRPRLAAHGRPLYLRVDDGDVVVHAARPAVDHILDVLCDNALRHGAGAVTLRVRPGAGGGGVISVTDEGTGLAATPRARPANVDGLGLRIAADLAAAQAARLRMPSGDAPATFELVLQ